MAYDKKYIGEKEVIKTYLDGREDKIGQEFSSFKNKIIDEGTNSNGIYRMWENGTLECWGNVEGTGNVISKPFPKPFVEFPYLLPSPTYVDGVGGSARLNYVGLASRTNASAYVRDLNTGIAPDFIGSFTYHAIGRWK